MTFLRTAFILALLAVPVTAKQEDGWINLYNGKDLTGWGYLKAGNGRQQPGGSRGFGRPLHR